MGDHNVEVLGDDTMNTRMNEEFFLVEGVDDTMNECPVHRGRIQNGIRHTIDLRLVVSIQTNCM